MPRVILNASHIGRQLDGIGVYSAQLLAGLAAQPTGLRFEVYLNEAARPIFGPADLPGHFTVKWVSERLSPDRGTLLRFLYSNLVSCRRRGDVIFNMSQYEAAFFGTRQIITVHDIIPFLLGPEFQRTQYYYFKYALGRGLRSAAAVVVPSEYTAGMLRSYYKLPAHKIKVIQHGIREGAFADQRNERGGHSPFILYAGRVTQYKNVDRLVRAFQLLQHKIEHNLVIAGAASYDIQPAVSDNPRIILRGHVADEELWELYRRASVFVFPSLLEGFGFPPAEAMACGCPVVVSDAASLPEVCRSAARYVDPNSVEAIAGGILDVLTDEQLRGTLIERGAARARELTWEKAARKYVELFEEVAGGG